MIEITFYKKKNRYAIRATGHADYAPAGQDIVCAAVSTLIQSLGNYIVEQKDIPVRILEMKYDYADIRLEFCSNCLDELVEPTLRHLYEMTKNGIEAIANQYPMYVKIEP